MMNKSLNVIVDGSGSMNEMGKRFLQRNLCRFISQLPLLDVRTYAELSFLFFRWTSSVAPLAIQDDGDLPVLDAEGKADLGALAKMLKDMPENGRKRRVLVLTDGIFETSKIAEFKKETRSTGNLVLRTVAVGPDADLIKLKALSTNETAYLPENISSAVYSGCFGTDDRVQRPESTDLIQLKKPDEAFEDWDV